MHEFAQLHPWWTALIAGGFYSAIVVGFLAFCVSLNRIKK